MMFTRYTAIHLSARGARDRGHAHYLAFQALRDIAFRGVMRSVTGWLLRGDIPLSCKARQLMLAPWKLALFLSGRRSEAAILEWRAR